MFNRNIITELRDWRKKSNRKPLVLRGARQVGKTTAVVQFSKEFSQFIHLNLERPTDREIFEDYTSASDILQLLFLQDNKLWSDRFDTLLFIDEIQESPEAIAILRYFFEEYPEISVVAAGSLLETIFDKGINFPVGRVEYLVLRPFSFVEFLEAMGELQALELFYQIPLPGFAHNKLISLFHTYTLIGGMPEVIKSYAETKDITALQTVYESLISTYFDDAEKYAKNQNQVQIIRHAVKSAFYEAGSRVKFAGFGASNYSSKEMGEVLRTLEKVMLLHLIYPTTQTEFPFMPDIKKSPRLQVLDTGMLNFFTGVQRELFATHDLNAVYQGRITEHIVGQEFLSMKYNVMNILRFWVRDKKQSNAELDFLFLVDGLMVPIEIKSGTTGKMRSLLNYIDNSNCNFAVRMYAGILSFEKHSTINGKSFYLLNLPYFLAGNLEEYVRYYKKKME